MSVDSFAAVGEFQEKLGLEFPLVSDFPRNQAGRDYELFNEDFGFHNRATFVIDSEGIVRDVYLEPRDFESHAPHALEALREINEG